MRDCFKNKTYRKLLIGLLVIILPLCVLTSIAISFGANAARAQAEGLMEERLSFFTSNIDNEINSILQILAERLYFTIVSVDRYQKGFFNFLFHFH